MDIDNVAITLAQKQENTWAHLQARLPRPMLERLARLLRSADKCKKSTREHDQAPARAELHIMDCPDAQGQLEALGFSVAQPALHAQFAWPQVLVRLPSSTIQ